jgi:hypothetical protein
MKTILATDETIKVCIGSSCENASKADPKGKYLQTDGKESPPLGPQLFLTVKNKTKAYGNLVHQISSS